MGKLLKSRIKPLPRLTYRAGKRHKTQQSSRAAKSVPRLASKLQRFASTGKVSKQDLRAIDEQLNAILLDQTRKIMKLLDQLKHHSPKEERSVAMKKVCEDWALWISQIESRNAAGYSNVKLQDDESRAALLESVISADADLFSTLSAFHGWLVEKVGKSSYEIPDFEEIKRSAMEIMEIHSSRQKTISCLTD